MHNSPSWNYVLLSVVLAGVLEVSVEDFVSVVFSELPDLGLSDGPLEFRRA
jgi:hypothetical protein